MTDDSDSDSKVKREHIELDPPPPEPRIVLPVQPEDVVLPKLVVQEIVLPAKIKGLQFKLNVLATFVLIMLLVIAFLLQRQQGILKDSFDSTAVVTHDMCLARQVNAKKTNATWDELAEIERRNTFINEDIRKARLKVYREAHLIIPICK